MDIFDSHYYNIHVFYLKFLGLWPNNDMFVNKIKQKIVSMTLISLIIPQIIRLVEEWGRDIDIVIELIGSLAYFGVCLMKYIIFSESLSKMRYIFTKIAERWENLTDDEVNVLKKYGDVGLRLTFGYLIPINILLVGYLLLPLFPILLDIIDPLNATRPKAFPYFAEYFIDDQKYYLQLTIHGWIVCTLSVQIFGIFDTTYTQVVQHACGLFAIVEQNLYKATRIRSNEFLGKNERDERAYNGIKNAIILHNEAIEFIDLIEDCYATPYLFIIPINTMALSIAIVDTMLNIEKNNMKQAIRIGMAYFGFTFHMLFNMSPGQRVIDISSQVHEASFHCEWFHASPKTKQLIKFIMLRSSSPSKFTAGKMFLLNFETFFFVFKKSLSYVAVITSMR